MSIFCIPTRDDDLLEISDTYYYVSELITDVNEFDRLHNKFQSYIDYGEFENISEFFDVIFTIIRHNETASVDQRMRAFELLARGISNLTNALKNHVSDVYCSELLTEELKTLNLKYSNCLLMYIYLISRLSCHLENYVIKKTKCLNVNQKNVKKGEQSDDFVINFWNSCDGRMLLLRLFHGIITIDATSVDKALVHGGIKFLWTPNIINEQLINCIVKTIMKILENSEAYKSTGKNILIAAFHVIHVLCVLWNQNKIIAKSLLELAPSLEIFQQQGIAHFPFIDVISTIQTKDELEPLLTSMIFYLGNFDFDTLATKSETSAKVFSLLITSMSEKFPQLLFRNVAHIVSFLSFDPPMLRNSVLTAFTEFVTKCMDEKDSNRINYIHVLKQKQTILLKLQDHIMDTSALVRTKTLNLWTKLALKCAIPIENFRLLIIRIVGDRLKDNSIMVRKAAINLLTAILSHNLFSSNLNFKDALSELNTFRTEKTKLCKKNPEFNIIRDVNKIFEEIEESIKEVIKLCLEELILSDDFFNINDIVEKVARKSSIGISSQSQNSEALQTQNCTIKTQDVLDSYYIASMIMNKETRIEGCIQYLKLKMRQGKEDFVKNMDINEMTLKLLNNIRDLLLQHKIAHNNRNDDQILQEEDCVENYCQQLAELDQNIEKTMDKLFFIKELEMCLPKARYCVKFGQTSELMEMIRFICECCKFKISGAQSELKKVFHLIWRKDSAIVDLIVEAGYDALFSKNNDVEISSRRTALNLLEIMSNATNEERVSLEETLYKIILVKNLNNEILDILWETADQQLENQEQSLIAIRLLAVVAKAQKHRIRPDLSRLVRLYRSRVEIVRIEVLRVIVALSASDTDNINPLIKMTFRIPSSDKLIKSMFVFLITEINSNQHTLWIPHCREVINVIYGICCRPYTVISSFFSKIMQCTKRSLYNLNIIIDELKKSYNNLQKLKDEETSNLHTKVNAKQNENLLEKDGKEIDNNAFNNYREKKNNEILRIKYLQNLLGRSKLRWELSASRMLYFAGEVALKFLTYLEVEFSKEIKTILKGLYDVRAMDEKELTLLNLLEFDLEKDTPLIQFERDCIRQRGFFEKADREDERIGLTAISEEEKLQIKLQKVFDRDTFSSSTINGRILPVVILILKSHNFLSESLIEAAIICLTKLMLVNSKCCEKFLPLIFNFYNNASIGLRNNLIIMMTDLCFRFPNVFYKYNDEYIKKVQDKNSGVRYTCLLVLSHMLLNDLIKISGRVADLAPCLCDEDKNIANLARGFFTELSKKHNVLYNTMSDIISKLTTNRELTMKNFEDVMRFLLQFIVKEQQKEALIEKICQRFQILKTHTINNNVFVPEALAFCIAQIPLNERCFRRLTNNLRLYQEFLQTPQVYKHFCSAITAFKKASSKSIELKTQIEEFEKSLEAVIKL